MKTLTLFLTHSCNHRCLFCCDDVSGNSSPPIAFDEAVKRCSIALEEGARRLVLIGGEPTLHPELPGIIRRAKDDGFELVQIATNGNRLKSRDYAEELRDAGLDGIGLSIHGAVAATHDRLTQRPGAFESLLKAFDNITTCGFWASTNTVVTRINVGECSAIIDLLEPYSVVRMQLAVMNPAELRGRLAELAISPAEAAASMCSAVRHAKKKGILCTLEALPLCLMPDLRTHAAERTLPPILVSDPARAGDDMTRFGWRDDKGYAPSCSACAWRSSCAGTYPEYFDLFPALAQNLVPVVDSATS